MNRVSVPLLAVLLLLPPAFADDERAKIKEQELEEVRERISTLKESMDAAARDRDRLTAELQAAEVAIAEKRLRLKELERERAFTEKRRAELDAAIAERETELAREAETLGSQLRAAYMSGEQERLKLLLNQQDPATLGRLMRYYDYLNDFRAANIDAVGARIRELIELRSRTNATRSSASSTRRRKSGRRCLRGSNKKSSTKAARSNASPPRSATSRG